jgi:1-acyl-sn-glycerol-3-phosphate acyltransferase
MKRPARAAWRLTRATLHAAHGAAIVAWRLTRATLHAAHGAAIVAWRFPRIDEAGRQAHIRWWSAKLLRVLGLRASVHGEPAREAVLVVANHVSWLDIAAIHAVAPHVRFVSKADVLGWPMIGKMVRGAGTLFIERDRKRDALRVVHQVAEALARGETVAVFPEGTTTDGHALLPFHANLLQAALAARVPVQPLALRYSDAHHAVSPAATFPTTLAASLWSIACAEGLHVRLRWLQVHEPAGQERRALAAALRERIAAALAAHA